MIETETMNIETAEGLWGVADPLRVQLNGEEKERYEAVRRYRERQSDPWFTEVDNKWRRHFAEKNKRKPLNLTEDL